MEQDPRQITVSVSDKNFNVDFNIEDAELIGGFLSLVKAYVKKGFPLKLRYTYGTSFSSSARIHTKVLRNLSQVEEFTDEMKQLLRLIKKSR